jgi:hypothetical protein
LYSDDLAFEVSRDKLNTLIMRGVVPVVRTSRKEVSTMAKGTIIKTWIWGSVIMNAAGILAGASCMAWLAHVVNVTAGTGHGYVPDSFFWTMIGLVTLWGIVAVGGYIAQVVAQIGALFNTHRLTDKTWFRVLLWCTIVGYLLIFVTLGAQLALVFSRSAYAAFVWPGYAVGALIEWTVMVCYLAAGPDGVAGEQPQIAMPAAPPKTLAPAG